MAGRRKNAAVSASAQPGRCEEKADTGASAGTDQRRHQCNALSGVPARKTRSARGPAAEISEGIMTGGDLHDRCEDATLHVWGDIGLKNEMKTH